MRITNNINTNFGNTFYLYPNKKNATKVPKLIDRVAYQRTVEWGSVNPEYWVGSIPKLIDGRKATSKEIFVVNEDSYMDKNIRRFCDENKIKYEEYTNEELQEMISCCARHSIGSGFHSPYKARIKTDVIENYIKENNIIHNFNELKEKYNALDEKDKKMFQMSLKSGAQYDAPILNCFSCPEEGNNDTEFYMLLSEEEAKVDTKIALNGYTSNKRTYKNYEIYFALKEMGIKSIPVVVDKETLITLSNIDAVDKIKSDDYWKIFSYEFKK